MRSYREPPHRDGGAAMSISETVNIPAGSVALAGNLEVPRDAKGLVLFAHGSGSSRHSPRNQFVARSLREAGSGTLLFDLMTANEENVDAYSGHLRFNIGFLADRLLAATRWVTQHPLAGDLGLGFFGSSTGGAAALMAATSCGDELRAIVSRGGRPDLAMDCLRSVKAPTLLIVGEHDELVLELNRRAFTRLSCERELAIVPRATHLFEEPGALEEVASLAADWFKLHWRTTHE